MRDTGGLPKAFGSTMAQFGRGGDDDKIKFVSIIDQKPIKPSYLELIPLKNYAKKEQEAQRAQIKESQKQESNEQKRIIKNDENHHKLLANQLGTEIQKREQMLKEVKAVKKMTLDQSIKLRKKQLINQNNGQLPTKEEIDAVI